MKEKRTVATINEYEGSEATCAARMNNQQLVVNSYTHFILQPAFAYFQISTMGIYLRGVDEEFYKKTIITQSR